MATTIITDEDLPAEVRDRVETGLLATMIAGANASAARVAGCLAEGADPAPSEDQLAEAKLVLLGAIKRWAEAGSGGYQQQTAGPFSVAYDTRQRGGFNLWPSEIESLQDICKSGTRNRRAFEVDTMPTDAMSGYPREGIVQVSQVSGKTYYSSDLGYLDTDPV